MCFSPSFNITKRKKISMADVRGCQFNSWGGGGVIKVIRAVPAYVFDQKNIVEAVESGDFFLLLLVYCN